MSRHFPSSRLRGRGTARMPVTAVSTVGRLSGTVNRAAVLPILPKRTRARKTPGWPGCPAGATLPPPGQQTH